MTQTLGVDASRINDGNFSTPTFSGLEAQVYFQANFGVGFWGNQLALGYDINTERFIRGATSNEIGPRINIGSNSPLVGVQTVWDTASGGVSGTRQSRALGWTNRSKVLVSSGTYFYHLRAEDYHSTKKLIILK